VSLGPPVDLVVGCAAGYLARGDKRATLAIDQADSALASAFVDFPLTINNRLRTGADKGNPTV
jgi:hypothetical protein